MNTSIAIEASSGRGGEFLKVRLELMMMISLIGG